MLDDIETTHLLFRAVEDLAKGEIASRPLVLATLTAREVIWESHRHRHWFGASIQPERGKACAPFQYALSTRTGTDCVGHAIRAATKTDPRLTVLSIDGIGAYDHVFRTAMLSKLLEVPSLRNLLPFARVACAQPSSYVWEDADGVRHNIEQYVDGEQGDPLVPKLFSLGLHNALEDVQQNLDPGEFLFVYPDDVFILSSPRRTREIFNLLENTLLKRAGIHLHIGNTRDWNACGEQLPDIDDLGATCGARAV